MRGATRFHPLHTAPGFLEQSLKQILNQSAFTGSYRPISAIGGTPKRPLEEETTAIKAERAIFANLVVLVWAYNLPNFGEGSLNGGAFFRSIKQNAEPNNSTGRTAAFLAPNVCFQDTSEVRSWPDTAGGYRVPHAYTEWRSRGLGAVWNACKVAAGRYGKVDGPATQGSGSGMYSVSPGTGLNRPDFQSSFDCSMRSRREETRFHQM